MESKNKEFISKWILWEMYKINNVSEFIQIKHNEPERYKKEYVKVIGECKDLESFGKLYKDNNMHDICYYFTNFET